MLDAGYLLPSANELKGILQSFSEVAFEFVCLSCFTGEHIQCVIKSVKLNPAMNLWDY